VSDAKFLPGLRAGLRVLDSPIQWASFLRQNARRSRGRRVKIEPPAATLPPHRAVSRHNPSPERIPVLCWYYNTSTSKRRLTLDLENCQAGKPALWTPLAAAST